MLRSLMESSFPNQPRIYPVFVMRCIDFKFVVIELLHKVLKYLGPPSFETLHDGDRN